MGFSICRSTFLNGFPVRNLIIINIEEARQYINFVLKIYMARNLSHFQAKCFISNQTINNYIYNQTKNNKMFKLYSKETANPQSLSIMKSAVQSNETILYMRSFDSNNKLITVCLSQQNQIVIRQCSIDKTTEVCYNKQGLQQVDVENIGFAFLDSEEAFLVFWKEGILRIFYGAKGEQKFIKLILDQDIQFERCMMEINYPNLVMFGNKKQENRLLILQLNLQTLQIKTVNQGGKGYSPQFRRQYLSVFADGRLYLFGGKDNKNKPCPKMIWVYDMEKGYWFALQMQYPDKQVFSHFETVVISSSRVLVMNQYQNKVWVLEVHQSRLSAVQNSMEIKRKNICLKGQLISYNDEGWNLWKKQLNKE